MILKIFIISFLLLIKIIGQVNTEKYRTSEDLEGLAGYLEVGGTLKTGNTEKTGGNLDGRIDWKSGGTTTFFVFETEHEWISGKRLSSNGLLHIRNVISINQRLKTEIYGQINYDKKLLIENRQLLGAGIRYKFFEHKHSDFSFGTSFMYEHEAYDLQDNSLHPNDVSINRWSNYLSIYTSINESVVFGGVVYFQPGFNNFSDFRLLNENSLNVKLSKLLSLSINFKMRHDSKPPDGLKKTDTKTDFGIALKF